ncbi:hypothetical protein D8T49_21500 [Vibrio vulnificus]|uniref:hypothetical protein n=1 Tax=Vibrio vulnificus TaxID=672 RepID=UPI0010232510|nr:hypothetical protein [Vibrio vulnificus]MCU8190154.1 hypothetical protein [Vibrio vulnificus]RZP97178.1 hypothetical protein D8T37_21020 [Vibrio vulnificus]RZQ44353.1 hypothetical protein D8T49_21500 [Vibrio vulnificus]
MVNTKASNSDATTQAQVTDTPNAPREYVMLKEKRILKRWREKGETITLTPSQAEYHLRNKNLELKKESK